MATLTPTYASLGNATNFSLLAVYPITNTLFPASITTNGDVGSQNGIGGSLTITYIPPGMLITDSTTIANALNDAITVFNQGIILTPTQTFTTAVPLEVAFPVFVTPGIYKFNSDPDLDSLVLHTSITFNGNGIYVFIIYGNFVTGAASQMILAPDSGASACDIYWLLVQNGVGEATLETGDSSTFIGNVITDPSGGNSAASMGQNVSYTGRMITYSQHFGNQGISFNGNDTVTLNTACVCFGKGTQIKTIDGYKYIENLQIDDSIITYGSIVNNTIESTAANKSSTTSSTTTSIKKLKWIGHYTDKDFSKNTYPVCFKKNSLGSNMPLEDLYVSPLHLIETNNGKMTCARNLINGSSVIWAKHLSSIDYYHIEFDDHCVVSANGLKAESLLGENNKFKFTY